MISGCKIDNIENVDKIGVGIVSYNRPVLLKKLLESIKYCNFVDLIIVNDGDYLELDGYNYYLHQNESNLGVGKSKNIAMKHLLDMGCDHIFIIEDDIFIKDEAVFNKYIEASKVSGIQHFNFSQHGIMNKTFDGKKTPNPRTIIDYCAHGVPILKVPLYPHCVGAFSYYSKSCLETVGLIDESYFNACEHVDHTYAIINAGMHPPFWYFADIENSENYLGDEEWSLEKSTISSNPLHQQMMRNADSIFVKKHGHYPGQTPLVDHDVVAKSLKQIKKTYGRSNDSNV